MNWNYSVTFLRFAPKYCMIDCINWYLNTEPALHPWDNHHWVMMYNSFVYWWILLIILYHLCLVWALRKYRLQMNTGVFTPLVFSAGDCIELMLTLKNTLQTSLVKQLGPSNFFYENFYIINSISLIAVSLFKWSISYWVSYGSLYFFRNWLISSKLSNLCV